MTGQKEEKKEEKKEEEKTSKALYEVLADLKMLASAFITVCLSYFQKIFFS